MLVGSSTIYVATQPIDLRASFKRLGSVIGSVLRRDPRSGDVFVFFNRRFNRVKILFYDRTGFCILYKRLDAGAFRLPLVIDPLSHEVEVERDELVALLEGVRRSKRTRARPSRVPPQETH